MEGSAAGPPAAGIQGFPVALTSFVGRAGALREAGDLLAEYRLVTVTGPGGVGKTRLAGEVARQVADRFADGAWLVELAAVPDPAQVPSAVVAALGRAAAAGGVRDGGADPGAGPAPAARRAGQLRARDRRGRRAVR